MVQTPEDGLAFDDAGAAAAGAGADAGAGAAGATGAVLATGAAGAGAAGGAPGMAGAGAAPELALPLEAPGAGAGAPPDAPDPPDAVDAETAVPQLPTGGPVGFELKCWTVGPGFGNSRITASLVVQPLSMLATNISGNESARFVNPGIPAVPALFFDPPVTVIGAQFMYISRFPMKLNQVHARV